MDLAAAASIRSDRSVSDTQAVLFAIFAALCLFCIILWLVAWRLYHTSLDRTTKKAAMRRAIAACVAFVAWTLLVVSLCIPWHEVSLLKKDDSPIGENCRANLQTWWFLRRLQCTCSDKELCKFLADMPTNQWKGWSDQDYSDSQYHLITTIFLMMLVAAVLYTPVAVASGLVTYKRHFHQRWSFVMILATIVPFLIASLGFIMYSIELPHMMDKDYPTTNPSGGNICSYPGIGSPDVSPCTTFIGKWKVTVGTQTIRMRWGPTYGWAFGMYAAPLLLLFVFLACWQWRDDRPLYKVVVDQYNRTSLPISP